MHSALLTDHFHKTYEIVSKPAVWLFVAQYDSSAISVDNVQRLNDLV